MSKEIEELIARLDRTIQEEVQAWTEYEELTGYEKGASDER